jgi:hypothetical protein
MSVCFDYSLGRFGDRRLDKGGRRFWNVLSRAKVSAFGKWSTAVLRRFGLGVFLRTGR